MSTASAGATSSGRSRSAPAVLISQPIIWGLSVHGADGGRSAGASAFFNEPRRRRSSAGAALVPAQNTR
jgi:hypothetical protein